MRWNHSAHRCQHGLTHMRYFPLEINQEPHHPSALQVLLRAAKMAGDDRILLERGKLGDVGFPAISHGAYDRIPAVDAAQNRRHRLGGPIKKQVQQKGLDDVIGMMAKCNLGTALLYGKVVKDPASEPRTERASSLPGGDHALHKRICVLLQDTKRDPGGFEIVGKNVPGKGRLLLIQVYREKIKTYRGAPLQFLEEREQSVTIFAATEADHYTVTVGDHFKISNRLSHGVQQFLLQLPASLHLFTPAGWNSSTPGGAGGIQVNALSPENEGFNPHFSPGF